MMENLFLVTFFDGKRQCICYIIGYLSDAKDCHFQEGVQLINRDQAEKKVARAMNTPASLFSIISPWSPAMDFHWLILTGRHDAKEIFNAINPL
jgi:hypothetical protein